MAGILGGLFGGKPAAVTGGESDFADYAKVSSAAPVSPTSASSFNSPFNPTGQALPYTKWYRVWERTSPSDFIAEAFIIPIILLVVFINTWGRRTNKTKARNWAAAHAPVLSKEFAQVGFLRPTATGAQSVVSEAGVLPENVVREKSGNEFISYASGRQNVAFLDVKLHLYKRYNPIGLFGEAAVAFFFPSFQAPKENVEAVIYPFDGREKDVVPVRTQDEQAALESRVQGLNSTYDGFVWAVVNKDNMRGLRDERYDISLTFTKDNAKLPDWVTVMAESAEISEQLLTPELIQAIEQAGPDHFETLIITDQPVDKPNKLSEVKAGKRMTLSLRLPSSSSQSAYVDTIPLFSYFLRLPDILVNTAHYRPEVLRKIKATREDEIRKLRKIDEDEKAEERKIEADKKKKEDRDRKLKGLSADEQRKFLDKEREKDQRKQGKKMQRKG